MRIGLEIAIPSKKYTFREQMIFFGKVDDAKFTSATIGKKNGNSLTQWNRWLTNFRFGDQVVPNFWESGIKIISSSIDTAAKKTTL